MGYRLAPPPKLTAVASRNDDLFPVARAFLEEALISVEPLDAEQQAAAVGDADIGATPREGYRWTS